jgi:hypothetical protein
MKSNTRLRKITWRIVILLPLGLLNDGNFARSFDFIRYVSNHSPTVDKLRSVLLTLLRRG